MSDVQTRISDLMRRNREFVKAKNELDNEARRMTCVLASELRKFEEVVISPDAVVRIEHRGRSVSLEKVPHFHNDQPIIEFQVRVDYKLGVVEYTHNDKPVTLNEALEMSLQSVESLFLGGKK